MERKKILVSLLIIATVGTGFVASSDKEKFEANIVSSASKILENVYSKIFSRPVLNYSEYIENHFREDNLFLRTEGLEYYRPVVEHEEAVINAVDITAKGVVSIIVSKDVPVFEQCPVTDPFFGPGVRFYVPCPTGRTESREIGGGTGFFISSDGLIITNRHVVSDKSADYTVFLGNKEKYDATVVGTDDTDDIALLKIEGFGFPVLSLGNSDAVRLGQTAIAIGNALGEFNNTVSVGVISGLSRTVTASGPAGMETIEDVFQTDAAINPGNSGGPLINLRGEVIAINTAIASGAENIGFAIPINKARELVENHIRTTKQLISN
jgi:serine protease Do